MEPPPWEDLDKLLIRSGLLQDAEGDPAEALLAELRSAVGDVYRGDPGYWLYRARIHVEARDIDAAIEANVRAREIDACRQISPWHRRRKENYQGFDPGWIDAITQQILNCSPDFEVYQAWMMMAFNERDGLDDRVLSRVRQATENRSLGYETYRLEKQLAQLDICCTGHDPESAWATLDRLFEAARSHRQHAEASGVDPGSRAISLALESLQFAQLALRNRFPQQAEKWRRRSDRLLEEHRHLIEQSPEMQPFLTVLKAVRSELEWLQARLDNRHADAVVHALAARANRHPWVEMEEVLASWRAAGGTEESFDDLLAGWGLKLPANWRGWRRLDEPLQAFELTDMRERVWTIADLDGKRTLVNLWAVWCGPCLLELPKVQELHERYRGDPDIQVITINLDGVEGVARELMRREGYDFPVLMHGSDEPAFEDVGIPRNWLVDSEGVRRWEQTGFSGDIAEHWVDDIASLIEGIE
jgi:thiol-disulfide isomerase/thioredoxin